MKLLGLMTIGLVLVLFSKTEGQPDWIINVTTIHEATLGLNITIQCTFIYPKEFHTENVQVLWKKNKKGLVCNEGDNDKGVFIFHKNDECVEADYRGRTKLLGDPSKGNCTLMIQNVTKSDNGIYMRLLAKGEQYSFIKNFVSIIINGVSAVTSGPNNSTITEEPKGNPETMYVAIFVPVAAFVVILLVTGIALKHKRSNAVTRADSGYYANCSRATSNPPNCDALSKKQEKKITEPKAIDEPVYINVQAPTTETHRDTDHMDHIYGNVDYLK